MVLKVTMTVQVALFVVILGLVEGLRVKRDLFQLAEMIVDRTGRDPLNFNGYGCYCGWGGSGTPVDKDDRCCQQHDDCYGQVTTDLPDCSPKWNHYKWNIMDKTVDCLDQTKKVKSKSTAILFKHNENCPRRICECDKALVECLYKNQYHNENYKLDKGLKCKTANKKGQM